MARRSLVGEAVEVCGARFFAGWVEACNGR
jgi:hypothetical protein